MNAPWKVFNATAKEICGRSEEELRAFCAAEPYLAAQKLLDLARNDMNLRMALLSDAWREYHAVREPWLDTYNAALTGLLASSNDTTLISVQQAVQQVAENCANELHGELPEKPEK